MKFICLQENLIKGLSSVSRVVSSKGSLPILSNILLQIDSGRLKLTATDLETSVVTWVGVKVEDEGSITVPAKLLIDLVRSLPGGQLVLSSNESQILNIESNGSNFNINGMSGAEFPSLPQIKGNIAFDIEDSTAFSTALNQVVFVCARDESRPLLTGALVVVSSDGLILAATDGFRLSEKNIGSIGDSVSNLSVVVPSKALVEVSRLISSQEGLLRVEIAENENQIIFRLEDLEIYSRLIEGTFPDYKAIVPTEFTTTVVVNTEELLRAVRLTSIFAQGGSNILKLEVYPDKGTLKLLADTQEVGAGETPVQVKATGVQNQIAFNAQYLIDCLNNLEGDEVEISLGESLKPALFKSTTSSDFYHIIMPVRVQS